MPLQYSQRVVIRAVKTYAKICTSGRCWAVWSYPVSEKHPGRHVVIFNDFCINDTLGDFVIIDQLPFFLMNNMFGIM